MRVLPESPLPYAAGEFAGAVSREVAGASFSVHMLGPYYGRVPGGGESLSLSRIQYEAARAVALPRFVWVRRGPDGAQVAEPLQEDFLGSFEQESESGSNLELVRCGLEELKDLILERVRPRAPDASDNPFFYISCTSDDNDKAQKLLSCLREENYEGVVSPVGDAEGPALRKHHRANLKRCDVFVTVYGQAPDWWVQDKLLEARDVAARRKKQKMTLSVCTWPPPRELSVALRDLRLWNIGDTFRCDEIKRFVRSIKD